MVVVRTITISLSLDVDDCKDVLVLETKVANSVAKLQSLSTYLKEKCIIVEDIQTVRIGLNPVEEFIDFENNGEEECMAQIETLASVLEGAGIGFASLGPIYKLENFKFIEPILETSKVFNLSASMDDNNHTLLLDFNRALEIAKVIKKVAHIGENASGSFRFTVSSNLPSGIPFFPSGYFDYVSSGKNVFALGLETSNLLVDAFERACADNSDSVLEKCELYLKENYKENLEPLQKACSQAAELLDLHFQGIDGSINPSLQGKGIGFAFQKVLQTITGDENVNIGSTGSLSLSYLITQSIRRASEESHFELCGYSGLMLPQMEDQALSMAASDGCFGIKDLLTYSSVCGVGIDTVPIPGNVQHEKLALLLLDMRSLSQKWLKPLSCRVLPVIGKVAGEKTEFNNPYLTDSKILDL